MATRPKRLRSTSVTRKATARKKPAKAAARKSAASLRTSAAVREAAQSAMRAAFAAVVRPTRPLSGSLTCATPPKVTSGTVEYDNTYTLQYDGAGATSKVQLVAFICHGSGFGTGVPVAYTPTLAGWSFAGSRPFCHVKKCSDSTASTDTVSVSGSLGNDGKIAFTYEVHAYCGEALVCHETGSCAGSRVGQSTNLLAADFRGTTKWTLTCCPDPVWQYAIDPPPKLPVGGRYIEPR